MSDHILNGFVDTSWSLNAGLKFVPLMAVSLTDSFWAPRLRPDRDTTLTAASMLEEAE